MWEDGMAASENPPIIDSAVQGWRYAFAALSRMPGVLGVGILVTLALNVATLPLMPSGPKEDTNLVLQLAGLLIGLVQGFLLTPVAIAVHRFVLLGEVAPRYALTPSEQRFMRFFIFTVVYQLLVGVPGSLMSMTGKAATGLGSVLAFIFFILFIVALIASIRMLILFPAIAVDARGADWRNAMADTKGHSWRVFFISLATSLPMLALVVPLYFMLGGTDGPGFAGGLVLSAVQAVVGVLALAAYAAVASRLFAAFSNRLNG
jgi:hypothetical protein